LKNKIKKTNYQQYIFMSKKIPVGVTNLQGKVGVQTRKQE